MFRAHVKSKFPDIEEEILDLYLLHIESSPTVDVGSYGEKHHILPQCLFPELKTCKWNLKRISAANHYLAHYWLWKLFEDKKLALAWYRMSGRKNIDDLLEKYAEEYELAKIQASQWMSQFKKGKKHPPRFHSPETIEKMAAAKRGKKHSEDTKLQMSKDRKGKPSTRKNWKPTPEFIEKCRQSHLKQS